ncbi:hypothetical protein [Coleofasciculus sp. E2-BRE-01]|uniref:hypothetical protein n=1 Tax=Coleofasciculus sp. E2-BRE-01 TaxID=3069524 RepID=UPI0033037B4F
MSGVGCRVLGVGCRVSGVGCRVWESWGCRDVPVERLEAGGDEGEHLKSFRVSCSAFKP